MSTKINVSKPLTNYRDETISVDAGGSILMTDGGFPAMVLGINGASRGERYTFRTGRVGIGLYSERDIPIFLFRAVPGSSEEGEGNGGNEGDIRARAALKIHEFPEGHREAFFTSEERSEGFVSVPIYLVETDPPEEVGAQNIVLGIRDEKIRQAKMKGVRQTAERQFSRYASAREEAGAAATLMKERSLDEMMESSTLTTNEGKLMSMAGEEL